LKPPAVRILLCVHGHRRFPDAFLAEHAIRDGLIRFHIPVATPVRSAADFVCPKPPDGRPPHWLTVVTIGCKPTVFAPLFVTMNVGA